jgi:acetyltransferase-like isoleucine patch superfamily enzyme/Flp pilus assembly protein TadD
MNSFRLNDETSLTMVASEPSDQNVALDSGLTLELGAHSYIHGGKIRNPSGALTHLAIGKFCSIATDLTIIGYDHHSEWITMYPFLDEGHRATWPGTEGIPFPQAKEFGSNKSRGNITIGSDVWIGYDVKLFKGITIGDGAVIGACSLVNKSVEPYTLVAGIPARPIRKRFSDAEIAILKNVQWWNLPTQVINRHMALLCSSRIAELEQALELDPDLLKAKSKIRAEEFLAQADAAYACNNLAAAREALTQAHQHDPDSVELAVCLGNLQFQLNDFADALHSFKHASERKPEDSDIQFRVANAALLCGETELAEKCLRRALALNPKNPGALRLCANRDFQQGRHAEAAGHCFALLRTGVEDAGMLRQLGECLLALDDFNSARWCFKRVLEMDPTDAFARQAMQNLTASPGPLVQNNLDPVPA